MNVKSIVELPDQLLNVYANYYWEYALLHDFRKLLKKSFLDDSPETNQASAVRGVSPVIVVGMHRSGTTVTSQLLRDSGVFMGNLRGKSTDESLFFQNLNKAIFTVAHAYWDIPESLKSALDLRAFHDSIIDTLRIYCKSGRKSRAYLGFGTSKGRSLFQMNIPWGWKDPRTCYTLPLWLKLFPKAKVVFVYRNGIDVAQSLHARNQSYIWGKPSSVRCLNLSGAFKIWELYNEECLDHIANIPSQQLFQIKYEDMLLQPESIVKGLYEFLEREISHSNIRHIIGKLQSSRAYAFQDDEVLIEFYNEVKNSPVMIKLGYNSLNPK